MSLLESVFLGETSEEKAKKDYRVLERSKIGCESFDEDGNTKVEIFI